MDIKKANEAIKSACAVGIIMGALTLIFSLGGFLGITRWGLIDAFLAFGLSFGIYKKSRVCSILLFSNLIFSRILYWTEIRQRIPQVVPQVQIEILWILIFGYFLFQGIRGTFAYHKIIKAKNTGEK